MGRNLRSRMETRLIVSLALKRLFIANRGEIARRIALTARRLGIETVVLTDRTPPPEYLLGIVSHFVQVPKNRVLHKTFCQMCHSFHS